MEGNITHTAITSYGYGTLRLKKGPNLPEPIFPTLHIFRTIFLLHNYSLRDPLYIRPRFFYFRDPLSRLTFATPFRDPLFAPPIRDPISRLPFATPFRASHSRPTFATHFRDSFSRLTFATTLATPLHDSRSRPHSRLSFATPDRAPNRDSLFLSRLPWCDSTTDGRTVLTPQRHLPSIPTLTLLKKKLFWNLLPGLASTTSSHPPSCPPPQWLCVP